MYNKNGNMTTNYTIDGLSKILGVKQDTLKTAAKRMDINMNTEYLRTDDILKIAKTYSKERNGRSSDTVNAAREILSGATPGEQKTDAPAIKFYNPNKKKKAIAKTVRPQKSSSTAVAFFKSEGFLFLVFLAAIGWQVAHTANIEMRVSNESSQMTKIALSYLFAAAVQFTALLMTINTGKIEYLQVFAFIEFVINMIYYEPWNRGNDPTYWLTTIVLSGAIAFTIYSYSELFVNKKS